MSGRFYAQAACTGRLLGTGPGDTRAQVERVMGAPWKERDDYGLLLHYGLVEFLFARGPEWRCSSVILHPYRIVDDTDVPPAIRRDFPEVSGSVDLVELTGEVRDLGYDLVLEKDDGGYRHYIIAGTNNSVQIVSDRSDPHYDRLWSMVLA